MVSLLLCVSHPALNLRRLSLTFTCIWLLASTWCKSGPKQGQVRSLRSSSLHRKAAYSPAVKWQRWKPHRNRERSQLCFLAGTLRSLRSTTSQVSWTPSSQLSTFFIHGWDRERGNLCNVPAQSSGLGYASFHRLFTGAPRPKSWPGCRQKGTDSGPGWENMEKRGWQPLGKTTAK